MEQDYSDRINELIANEDLIQAVLNNQLDEQKWIEAYQIPVSVFRDAVNEIESLHRAFPTVELSRDKKSAILKNIEDRIDRGEKSPLSVSGNQKQIRSWLVAASILLCLGVVFFLNSGSGLENVSTRIAQSEQVEMMDGSSVYLGPESTIQWNSSRFEKNRKIELAGEAFFEVKKGDNFEVASNWGIVEVLGTSFNIRDRAERYEVSCRTGKVRVQLKNGEEFILTKGMHLYYDPVNQKSELSENSAESMAFWMDGEIYLKDVSVDELIEEFKRQFDVELEASEALRTERGNFMLNLNHLDSSLYQVSWPLRAEIEKIDQDHYRIKRK